MAKTKAEVLSYAPKIIDQHGRDITEAVFDSFVRDLSKGNKFGTHLAKAEKGKRITQGEYETLQKAFNTINSPTNSGLFDTAQIAYFDQTPLTNRMGRRQAPTPGKQVQVDTLVGIPTNPSNPFGRTPAGRRGSEIAPKFLTQTFPLVTIGQESNVIDELVAQGEGYLDALAVSGMAAFYGSRRSEEINVLLSNLSQTVATPATPTVTNATTGGSIAAATYNVICVAVTHEGYLMALANTPLALVAATQTITNPTGFSYTANGGHSNKSTAGSTTTTGATSLIRASVPAVVGAHWYAWYVGVAGSETLQGFTGQSSATFTSLSSGNQNASAITSDVSRALSGYAFDGLLTQTYLNSALYSYVYQMPINTGTNKASTLTNSNGQCAELNNMFAWAWQTWRISPDLILVSARENVALNGIFTTTGSTNSPLTQYIVDTENNQISAGLNVAKIMNVSANVLVPVMVHPDLPAGSIFAWTQDLSKFYQGTTINQSNELVWDRDWTQEAFPRLERSQSTGCYANETLANKFPGGLMAITNIGDTAQV